MKQTLQLSFYIFMALVLSLSVNVAANAAADNNLLAAQWEQSRGGDALRNIPVINKVVNLWSQQPNQKIELHYPGGEDGELWVGELIDWLVSLGVPSKNIVVVPGSGMEDVIRLYVVKIGESYK